MPTNPETPCPPPQGRAGAVPASGAPAPAPTFVQLFDTLVSSGLLARLSGNGLTVLLTLGLAGTPLGSGSQKAEAFFRDLVAAGAVSPGDRRRLFCGLPHHELVHRTGLGKNAVTRCTRELAGA